MTLKKTTLRIGSRKSPLAMVQSEWVAAQLKHHWPYLAVEIIPFVTEGDRFLDAPLSEIGDKGLFVKELEYAMLAGEIDCAIHSAKDMLSVLPEGLHMQSVGKRVDSRDVLVSLDKIAFHDLPDIAVVGTASLRRTAQLKKLRPELTYKTVRGNLQTRLKKMHDGDYDALVLAAAGIQRMGLADEITEYFHPESKMVPACAQGILAVEFRSEDTKTAECFEPLNDAETEMALQAERAFLKRLEGGCQVPMGANARLSTNGKQFDMRGIVLSSATTDSVAASIQFDPTIEKAIAAGDELAGALLFHGAGDLLREVD